jgi:calcineurin-like phosphoesterase family protein
MRIKTYQAYSDVYDVLKDCFDRHVSEHKILPEREDLLQFIKKKMVDHEIHGHVHECLINPNGMTSQLARILPYYN